MIVDRIEAATAQQAAKALREANEMRLTVLQVMDLGPQCPGLTVIESRPASGRQKFDLRRLLIIFPAAQQRQKPSFRAAHAQIVDDLQNPDTAHAPDFRAST